MGIHEDNFVRTAREFLKWSAENHDKLRGFVRGFMWTIPDWEKFSEPISRFFEDKKMLDRELPWKIDELSPPEKGKRRRSPQTKLAGAKTKR